MLYIFLPHAHLIGVHEGKTQREVCGQRRRFSVSADMIWQALSEICQSQSDYRSRVAWFAHAYTRQVMLTASLKTSCVYTL